MSFPSYFVLFIFAFFISYNTFAENIKRFEGLIVNGTRLDQNNIEDLPLNISIITAEEIKLSPAKTLPELLSMESGIQKSSQFGNHAVRSDIDIRGFGARGTQNTLILLDGKRLNDNDQSTINFSAIPIENIERIEIIKSAGGVLYGDGAVGGAINIITKTPSYKTKKYLIEQTLGSYDSIETDVAAKYSNDKISLNLFGNLIHSDGYRVNNKLEQQSLLANLSYFFQNTEFFMKFGRSEQNLRLPGDRVVNFVTGVDEFSSDRKGSDDPFDFAIEEGTFLTLGFIHPFGDHIELLIDGGYKTKDTDIFLKANGEFRNTSHANIYFSPQLKWKFELFNTEHNIDVGFDIYHYQFDLDIENTTAADTNHSIAQPQHRLDIEQENYSLYLNDFFKLTSNTSFQAGARIQHSNVDAFDQFDSTARNAGFASSQRPSLNKSDRGYMTNFGIKHQFNSYFSSYITIGQSMRFANNDDFNQLAEVTFVPSFSNIKPQRGRYLDGGVTYSSEYINTSLSVYLMQITNQIDFDPARSINRNFEPIKREGLEYSIQFKPIDEITTNFNYAFTKAVFDEGLNKGNDVPLVAKHTANLAFNYNLFRNMNLSATWNYVGDKVFDNDQDNTFFAKIPSHSTIDMKLGYERGNFDVDFSVNNLLNKEYFETGTANSLLFDAAHTRFNASPMPERNFSFTIRHKFN
jgi:iron complex outermembrane receptor protein